MKAANGEFSSGDGNPGRPRSGGARSGVRLKGLSKSFGPVKAVAGVDLDIAAGETVALLGPNGAGKSTTIEMALGLLAPDAGSIEIYGMSPAEAIRAGAIGAMLQTGQLLRDLTVAELLTMMGSFYPNPLGVNEVMALTGIADIADRRTEKLSGGQTQRVRAAIALISRPELLFLDEPTVAMDVEGRQAFWRDIRRFASGGKTVLFATHYLEEADAFADRIVLMARGRIVADGPATEIKAAVHRRTLRATLPSVDVATLLGLPGVATADRRGEAIVLSCTDSDATVRALLARHPELRDLEITGAGLEEAFLLLTGEPTDGAAEGAADPAPVGGGL
ncbi:MAG: ABC transporter ATP-binding protein [Actinomycetota bacterium]